MSKILPLLLLLLSFTFGANGTSDSQKLSIIVSVPPLVEMIERLGGEQLKVQALVPQGKSPELFEPSITQMKHIQNADIFFGVGMPFEDKWRDKFQALNPKLVYINLAKDKERKERDESPQIQNLAAKNLTSHNHASHNATQATKHTAEHAHSHNPHIWLSPIAALKQIQTITQALSQAKPESSQIFNANAEALKAQLEHIIQATRALFAKPESHKSFLIYHPAFEMYASDFALTQLSLERDGKELKGRDLSHLITEVKTHNIRAIFIQPEFSKQRVSAIARELGLEVIEINPLNPAWLTSFQSFACQIALSSSISSGSRFKACLESFTKGAL